MGQNITRFNPLRCTALLLQRVPLGSGRLISGTEKIDIFASADTLD